MNRIAQLRKEKRLSQADLAEKINVHQTAISQWEQGRTNPTFEAICNMCTVFDVTLDYLMGYTDIRRHFNLTDEEQDQLGRWVVEEYEEEFFSGYKKLDGQGKHLLETILKHELQRMRDERHAEEAERNAHKEE